MSLEKCGPVSVQVGTTIQYKYRLSQPITGSGGYSRTTTDLTKAKQDIQSMYDWKLDYVTSLYNTKPGSFIQAYGSFEGYLVVFHLTSFDDFKNSILTTSSIPVYETKTVCEQLTIREYLIRIPSYSDAQPYEELHVTIQQLKDMIEQTHQDLADLKLRFESDPSSGRLKSIQLTELRLEYMHKELNRIVNNVGDIPSVLEIVADKAPLIGTPVNQVIGSGQGPVFIEFDEQGHVRNVRNATAEDIASVTGHPSIFGQLEQLLKSSNPFLLMIVAVAVYGAYEYFKRRGK